MDMIKTPNDDRDRIDESNYLKFEMPFDGTVYVALDSRSTILPTWLNDFSNTGEIIQTSLNTQPFLQIYSKSDAAGDCVDLGANKAGGVSGTTAIISSFMAMAAPPPPHLHAGFQVPATTLSLQYYTDRTTY